MAHVARVLFYGEHVRVAMQVHEGHGGEAFDVGEVVEEEEVFAGGVVFGGGFDECLGEVRVVAEDDGGQRVVWRDGEVGGEVLAFFVGDVVPVEEFCFGGFLRAVLVEGVVLAGRVGDVAGVRALRAGDDEKAGFVEWRFAVVFVRVDGVLERALYACLAEECFKVLFKCHARLYMYSRSLSRVRAWVRVLSVPRVSV